jgi:hypothetical protein
MVPKWVWPPKYAPKPSVETLASILPEYCKDYPILNKKIILKAQASIPSESGS